MATTIFDINQNDLSPQQLEALKEQASAFLGAGDNGEVETTQEQVVQKVEKKLVEGFSLEESVGQLRNSLEEKNLGTPDTNQRVIIKRMPEELREKLEGKLFFRENTTEIILANNQKLVFDKQQKFTEPSDWQIAMDRAKSIKQRLLTKEEFEGLFNLFKIGENYYGDDLKNILNVIVDDYWSSSSHSNDSSMSLYARLIEGQLYGYTKIGETIYALYVHK